MVNFWVAILILKMEEEKQHFWHSILYCFKVKNATEPPFPPPKKKKICAVYEEGAVTGQMYQKWFAKFGAGDFLLDDTPVLVNQLKLIATKSRHSLRTINIIPCRR